MPALQTWPSTLVNSNMPSSWPSSTCREDAYAVPVRSLIETRTGPRHRTWRALHRARAPRGEGLRDLRDARRERGTRRTAPPLLLAHDTRTRSAARNPRGPAKPLDRARSDPGAAVIATPPRLAERLLAWSMRDPSWRESVLGDLSEEFSTMSTQAGVAQCAVLVSQAGLRHRRATIRRPPHRTIACSRSPA